MTSIEQKLADLNAVAPDWTRLASLATRLKPRYPLPMSSMTTAALRPSPTIAAMPKRSAGPLLFQWGLSTLFGWGCWPRIS